MISNSSAGKLKASQSPGDLEYEGADDADGNQAGRGGFRQRTDTNCSEGRGHSGAAGAPKTPDGRIKLRPRYPGDFRGFRGLPLDRRGSGRPRGTFVPKHEREPPENSYRRYQEPLNKNSSGDSNLHYGYSSKHSPADPNNSHYSFTNSKYESENKPSYYSLEDPRISKLLRRLCAENDVEKSLAITSKLQEAIMLPDNARYIRRSYDILAESLLDSLYEAPSLETKIQVAACLGRIGFVMGTDYKKHLDWVMATFNDHQPEEVKTMLILSFCDLFQLDAEELSFGEYAAETMTQLQTVIESTDSAKIFTAAVDAIIILSRSYLEDFSKHFVDMVDILVGWHVDAAQSKKVKDYALSVLEKLNYYWRANLSFSVKLLGQFLEDMVAYGEGLSDPDNEKPSSQDNPSTPQECIQRITSFMNVFSTVTKSLAELLNPNVSPSVTWAFLVDSFSKMLKTYHSALKVQCNKELIVAGNECSFLFLDYLQSKVSSNSPLLYKVIYTQLGKCSVLTDEVLLTVINLIRKAVKEISGNLPIEFIRNVIGPESQLLMLRFSKNQVMQENIVSLYQTILNLKNIPLLQEAYRYVLDDIETSYQLLSPDTELAVEASQEKYSIDQAAFIILFNLQCLTEIANASNSIIGMWALQPSILELLTVKLKPFNSNLSVEYPMIQYCILYLLYSHCTNNNHFIASSDLVTFGQQRANVCDLLGISNIHVGEGSTTSPTSGHFGLIIALFNKLFECKLPTDTLLLILKWTSDIYLQLEACYPAIFHAKVMTELVMNTLNAGFSLNERVVEAVANNMDILMKNRTIPWNNTLMTKLGELCLVQIDSDKVEIRKAYTMILSSIPWDIVILSLIKASDIKTEKYKSSKSFELNKMNIIRSQKEHLMRDTCGQISPQYFKFFMGSLLFCLDKKNELLNNSFLNCWPLKNSTESDSHLAFFRQCAQNFTSVSTMWATWECAQLCTTLKLRTPLGKPQETFTSIESAIKRLARELISKDAVTEQEMKKYKVSELKRSRLLVEFMEFLEKAIHNAAEGCATVMLPVIKSVRTFFHTNSLTCREWVNRVRPAALQVALHSGHSAATVRHTHCLLQGLTSTHQSIQAYTPEVSTYCMTLARALIQLKEPEALMGLYSWIKKTYRIKVPWIKAAAEQAALRYESALNQYNFLTNKSTENDAESKGSSEKGRSLDELERKMINDQIVESYKSIQSWSDLRNWKQRENDSLKQSEANKAYNLNDIYCYSKFQEDEIVYPKELCDWESFLFEEKQNVQWSCFNICDRTESILKNIALKIMFQPDYLNNAPQLIEESIETLQFCLHELSRNQPCDFITDAHIQFYAAVGLKKILIDRKPQINPFFTSTEKPSLKNVDPSVLNKVIWWTELFSKLNASEMDMSFLETMRLDLVKSSRKHGNFNSSKRELVKYFRTFEHYQNFPETPIRQLEDVYELLVRSTSAYDMNIWSYNNIGAIMETSKLLHVNEDTSEMAINLCASASLGVSQRLALGEHTYEFRERGTRMLLTLSKWVQNESDKILINNLNSPLTKLVTALPEIGLVNNNVSANVIPISDSAVGKLLQFSVNQCPGLAKAWFTFGSWCFRWGRKMVEYSSNMGGQLTDADKLKIETVMMHGSVEDFETVCEILSKTRVSCDEEDIDWNEINTSEMIESQLRSVPSLHSAYPEHLIVLVDIWRQAQKRVFSYYELSADAYFKFLELSSASENINHNGECAIVTATLRLLRLIVKHAMELQNVLESGLANTPTQPWKVIIPQLFSRLNHPENYVRRCVSELLCRLAEDTPHLITFPAVVGAVENEKINLADIAFPKSSFLAGNETEVANDDSDSSDAESEKDNDLNCCFMDMVDTLSKQAPETILQVQLLVKELRRINLLWDELWLGTLAQHHSEITRRLAQLDMEILKVKNNVNLQQDEKEKLIIEKHRIILKPILFVLEQLADITSVQPETPHEQNFRDKFHESITDVLVKLRSPADPDKPQESWLPIKQLQLKFQQKSNKRSAYALRMSDISPILANMTNTVISMPGVQTSYNVRITIMSIDNTVAILPTKTKPKKLVFHGSDGKSYTYLFKGLEDLHLDERIMQFLSITNTMMAHDKEDDFNQTYRARHYSVIPLGPRSGLISWVDNLTPLFALYKRWQQREAVTLSVKNNKSVMVLRPSELFYNKLTPLLKAAGVSTDNRKEWPASILKQVLIELMNETPKDLLSKELWCGSVTPGQWWRTVRRYSFSVAVMSTIGYIIGLGDRHLDNVLVDLSTGEVVHIDYNVCFEKGKTLRVPEKVPFRMTPNLERALGVTGVEGIFRLGCEHALKTAKRGRETLLTLLEAFVYDPLVEWGGGTGGGGEGGGGGGGGLPGGGRRARLEGRCDRDMLLVRVAEARQDWSDNREEICKQLSAACRYAASWLEQLRALSVSEGRLQQEHRQMALVRELEALGPKLADHPLYAAAQRYTAYRQMRDALDDSAKSLLELYEDCGNKIENFTLAMETIKSPQLNQWIQELNFPIDHDGHLVFGLIKEFLLNAGQNSMITQCEQSEAELGQYARQQTLLIKNCLELLSQYAAVVQYYPQSFMEKHRIVLYRKWSEILLETDSPDVCREVMLQVQGFLAPDNVNNPAVQQAAAFSYQLQGAHKEANSKLTKLIDRLQSEGGTEALPRCEKNFLDAKSAIASFVGKDGAERAMECVIITTLCNLNKRYLMLESGAHSAGDCIVDLTSRDGEWFLDDMSIISSLIVELIAYIPPQHKTPNPNDECILTALDSLRSSKSIFLILQELSCNFQMIILPEAIMKIQAEEPSVLRMINELNSVVLNTSCPLNDLLTQLEMHLRYIIMEMESPSGNAQVITADLRMRYEALVSGVVDPIGGGPSSPGRKLLMGSDGLFVPLAARGTDLLNALSTLHVPTAWKKINQIREAKELAAQLHNKHLRSILDDIFFIKRIQALTEFFSLSVQMSCAFKGVGAATVHNDQRLYKPIKRFMADFIRRQYLGVQSQCVGITVCLLMQRLGLNINKEIEQRDIGASCKVSLEELCEVCNSSALKSGIFTSSSLQQANALCANLEAAYRRRETIIMLERCARLQSTSVGRLRLQATAHGWLRGEGAPPSPSSASAPGAAALSAGPPAGELRRAATQLAALQPRLAQALEKHRALVASAEQRLKWASGANPALNEVMAAFECAVSIREDRMEVERLLAAGVGGACAALGAELRGGGASLPALAGRRRSALALAARAPPAPAPLHHQLLQMLRPEGNIDQLWVNNILALITDMMQDLQKHIGELKKNVLVAEDILKLEVNKLSNVKMAHDKIISDGKTLLKSIAKSQDTVSTRAQEYLAQHGSFIEELTNVTNCLNGEKMTEESVVACIDTIAKLETETQAIYEEFISFEGAWKTEEGVTKSRRGTLVRQSAGVWASPARQITAQNKGKGGQQQNAYAASVWKRVRLKLEGRDPDPARKHNNQEQIEYIINEAMSLENLCLLYEGWTPWV